MLGAGLENLAQSPDRGVEAVTGARLGLVTPEESEEDIARMGAATIDSEEAEQSAERAGELSGIRLTGLYADRSEQVNANGGLQGAPPPLRARTLFTVWSGQCQAEKT